MNIKSVFVATVAAIAMTGCAAPGYMPAMQQGVYQQQAVYGTVKSVQEHKPVKSSTSAGATGRVAGGVIGGLIGHQIGKGKGRTAATIIGALGGASLGNSVAIGSAPYWSVDVKMDNGSTRRIQTAYNPGVRAGQRVAIRGGQVYRVN